jgi:hypothetical protein
MIRVRDLDFFDGHYDAAFSAMTASRAVGLRDRQKAERVWGGVLASCFDVLGVAHLWPRSGERRPRPLARPS